jgi:DNA-binding Lrp family transcriptional regulator
MIRKQTTRAVRLYERGRTLREIADELGVDPRTVWRHIRDQVDIRRPGPRGRADVTDEVIVALRGQPGQPPGASWPEIAAEVGMSRTGVRARWLRATGQERWR